MARSSSQAPAAQLSLIGEEILSGNLLTENILTQAARHTGNSSQVVGQGVPGWCLYLPGRPFPRTGTAAIAESQRSDSGPGPLSRSQSSTGPVIFCA